AAAFTGDFAEGLEIDRNPAFNGWLTAQRRKFRGYHAAILERLVGVVPDDEVTGSLDKWLEIAPFDRRVHELMLNALARRGQIREGEEHLAATARLFEADGLDSAPLRDIWQAARAQQDASPRARAVAADPEAAPNGERTGSAMASRRAS